MKPINKAKIGIKAAIVIAVALAFILPTSAVVTNTTTPKNYPSKTMSTTQHAIHKALVTPQSLGGDVLISSDNPDKTDETPKITMNTEGTIVVTYEKEMDALTRVIPICYSKDLGQTWTEQFEIDSTNLQGSGYLQSVDIKYSPDAEQFFWQAIDPLADIYNEEIYWIPAAIEEATEITGWGISGLDSTDYTEGALTYVGPWVVGLAIHTYSGFINDPGLGYFWFDGENFNFPVDVDPSWAAGYYYDAMSVLRTCEASKPEMATGNQLYMVMESFNGVSSNISLKSTVTDLNPSSETFLYTSGGGPSGMDKFADIEVWPLKQEYVAVGATDPDIAAKGDVVAVVYMQGGDVKCSTSTNGAGNWTTTTVTTGAGYPAVYVTKDKIYAAYVKEGNLSYVISSDNGATWGTPTQVNDVAGTVVAQPGSIEIGAQGFIWTDNRSSGKKDIYFEYMEIEPPIKLPKLTVNSITGGIGVSAKIGNIGKAAATNVVWQIQVTGGLLGRINVSGTGTIASLAVNGEDGGKTKTILGLGSITIKVTATCDEGSIATMSKDGTQLLFWTIVK